MAAAPFHRKPKPSEQELHRLGMGCYAKQPAACRELALISLPERFDTTCGTFQTDDPNGPVMIAGRVNKPACKPPTYRRQGACGRCELPTLSCGEGKGGPFGHKTSQCPSGALCSSFGYCFPKEDFPVMQHNVPRGGTCYIDRECASQRCPTTGMSAFGDVGTCT